MCVVSLIYLHQEVAYLSLELWIDIFTYRLNSIEKQETAKAAT